MREDDLTISRFAKRADCSESYVRHLIRENRIRAEKRFSRWRIPVSELERLLVPDKVSHPPDYRAPGAA
jgi:excisionase family DNA binding protein